MLFLTKTTPSGGRRSSGLRLPALLLVTTLTSQAALTVTFDNPNDLTTYFTNASGTPIGLSSTAGIGGSGAVDLTQIPSGDTQFLVLKTPFAGNLSNWNVSVYGYNGSAAAAPVTFMGISTGPVRNFEGSPSLTGSDLAPFLALSTGEAFNGAISTYSYDGGPGFNDDRTFAMGTNLTAFTWYRHDLSVVYQGGNNYTLTASIYEVDANGNNPVLRGTAGAQQHTNSAFAADPSVYLFLGVYNGAALDNFSTDAVPEPSSLALALGGCALAFRRKRAARR
ncbi:MAG: PEP-CTERM sorting domain-containing protein [Myxococcaceae bacterium]|nr:MAG: PEP-CTERM sorting domain-containing protein [Myxococcaceae bacterium]